MKIFEQIERRDFLTDPHCNRVIEIDYKCGVCGEIITETYIHRRLKRPNKRKEHIKKHWILSNIFDFEL